VPLDDVIIETATESATIPLALQLKRTFNFAPSHRDFAPIVDACWETFQLPDFQKHAARFGVGLSHFPVRVKAHCARVPDWARTASSADEFFDGINRPKFASNQMRTFVTDVMDRLRQHAGAAATNDACWQFFQHLVIVNFDFGQDASSDRVHTVTALQQLTPGSEYAAAELLYAELRQLAERTAQTGGRLTAESLRAALLGRPVQLGPAPSLRGDLERLNDHTKLVLGSIDVAIAGLSLDRSDVVVEVLEQVDHGAFVMLAGAPGVGKSALLRRVAEARQVDGPVIAFSADRFRDVQGWDGLASRLRLVGRLPDLIVGISGTARPCLVIDGLDRLDESGARLAVNDLFRAIRALPIDADGNPRWSIVATARQISLDTIRMWLEPAFSAPHVIQVPELDPSDVEALAERLPHLRWVLRSQELGPVIRNPYFLRILEQAREGNALGTQSAAITEGDVLHVWWAYIVGRDNDRGRQDVMLRLAESALGHPTRRLATQGIDSTTLGLLERDDILRRDPGTDQYWFGHDILEDWTVARLLAHQADVFSFLESVGQPFWADHALQLLACDRLERQGVSGWRELFEAAESRTSAESVPHVDWALVVLTAPLQSAHLFKLMDLIGPLLLEGDGLRLARFLRVVRTRYLVSNPTAETVIDALPEREDLSAEERQTYLLELAHPDLAVWVPVLLWLAPRLSDLVPTARDEASRMMFTWQRSTAPDLPFRRDIAEAALSWRRELTTDSGDRVWIRRENEQFFDRVRDIILFSAANIPAQIPAFLQSLIVTDERHRLEQLVGRVPHLSLAAYAAAAYADFALDVLVPKWRGGVALSASQQAEGAGARTTSFRPYSYREEEDSEWQRLHLHLNSAFLSPSHLRGPFLLLLRTNEREGLRLVQTLVDRATAAYRRNNQSHTEREDRPLHLTLAGQSRRFLGDAHVYQWFRPNGNAPYPVRAALMALEVWMEEQVEADRDPTELIATVLEGTESLAFVGVCLGITLAYPNRCLAASEPFLTSPLLFEYDIGRFVNDQHGTFAISEMLTGQRDDSERAAVARDSRPQRRTEIRNLVALCLFKPDEALANRVAIGVRGFVDNLSGLTALERANPDVVEGYRRHMENYAAWGDPANFRWVRTPGGDEGLLFEPPEHLRERNIAVADRQRQMSRILSLKTWAEQTIKEGIAPSSMILADAVAAAITLGRRDDFSQVATLESDTLETMRIDAIAETAAAVLIADLPWVDSAGHLNWCVEILVDAAGVPRPDNHEWTGLIHHGVLEAAAHGLMSLVEHGRVDTNIRLAIIGLLRWDEDRVTNAVIGRLPRVWDQDPVLSKNVVARELAFATLPRYIHDWDPKEHERRSDVLASRIARIESECEHRIRLAEVPPSAALGLTRQQDQKGSDISDADLDEYGGVHTSHVIRALRSVPHARIADGTERSWMLDLAEGMLVWTLERYADHEDRRSYERPFNDQWPDFFGNWIGWVADAVPHDEFDRRFLNPIGKAWPVTAELMGAVLAGYTRHVLTLNPLPTWATEQWRLLAHWMLPDQPGTQHSARDPREAEEALGYLVHVRYGRSMLTADWPHPDRFADVYASWVATVAAKPWGFRKFLVFLDGVGLQVSASRAIGWLASAVDRIQDRPKLWRTDGTALLTAQILARLWRTSKEEIRNEDMTIRSFVQLIDELVQSGVPLAAQIRSEI
jgi:hypothetical protein